MAEEDAGHHPIACEPCRQKKRKCDRKLPICLQCTSDPSKCVYPESNKRGIPTGYLNKLESRLSETEDALFRALASLHTNNPDLPGTSPSSLSTTQGKAERMQEWDRLPLRTDAEMRAWFASRREVLLHGEAPEHDGATEVERYRAEIVDKIVQGREDTWEEEPQSKAGRQSRKERNLYF